MPSTRCGFDDGPQGSGRNFLALIGPTLFVNIGFDPAFRPNTSTVPALALTKMQALVDTGASESCIDNLVGAQLKLPIVDRRPIAGVHGAQMANMYLAQIHVIALGITLYGQFAGVDLAAGGQVHRALIGRTFLQNVTMTYDGRTGTVTISTE